MLPGAESRGGTLKGGSPVSSPRTFSPEIPVNEPRLLPQHRAAGARLTSDGTLLTYGDVPAEYAAAREGCVLFDVCTRGAVRVTGADAESFLHATTSNQVAGLAVGAGCRALLLSSKGKVEHDFDLSRTAAAFHLSTPPERGRGLVDALERYRFAEAVELEEATADHAPLEVTGPAAADLLERLLNAPPPSEPHCASHATFEGAALVVTRLPVAGPWGWRLDAGAGGVELLWRALVDAGARPAGLVVRDSLRIEEGRAEWGRDIDDTVYPQEARLEEAYSLEKGCFVGQEVVSKIDTYGGLNKRLVGLRVDHDDPVPAGTRLLREEGEGEWRDLGVVTSWAYSFALDGGAVLGFVKRKHQEEGTLFRLGEGPATARIVELPLTTAAQ